MILSPTHSRLSQVTAPPQAPGTGERKRAGPTEPAGSFLEPKGPLLQAGRVELAVRQALHHHGVGGLMTVMMVTSTGPKC